MSTILRAFTEAASDAERKKLGISSGYVTTEGREYPSYMDNESWSAMVGGMNADHLRQYMNGGGGELREENGRPPKMASFISSSRMIYLLSREIPGFVFEAKRPTIVGGIANLDGCLERERKIYYVESKLREPYSHSAVQRVKVNYQTAYAWLRERMPGIFDCVMEDRGGREMDVVFLNQGRLVSGFDIKQMVCHLLGIAAHHLQQKEVPERVCFLYLLYDPTDLTIDAKHADEIMRIHRETAEAALGYRFEMLFGHIVDYLTEHHGFRAENAAALKQAFCFHLCSQDTYHSYFQ